MKFLAKGKRGSVYLTDKGTIIKKAAENRIENEIYWLKKLNKYSIGPKLINYGWDFIEIEYVNGELIGGYLAKFGKKKVIRDCLKQCRIMDKLKVNKKEMTNPYKHIIIVKDKAKFIDFERCKITPTPKNVTQFLQYLAKKGFVDMKVAEPLLKEYKRNQNNKNFKEIFSLFS